MPAAFEGEHRADVAVLGAGLTGCAAAFELARRGLRTVILEAGSVGAGASASDLGHLSAGPGLLYAEAVEQWGRHRARAVWEAQRETHARLRELLGELADDCGYRAAGGFVLAEDRDQGVRLAESEDLLHEDGFAGEFLDQYMLETRFDVTGFAAGYWAAEEAELDARRLVQTLARAARGLGARLYERTPVLEMELGPRGAEVLTARGRLRAGWAFVALGAATPRLVRSLEPSLRMVHESGAVFELEAASRLPAPARAARGAVAWRLTPRGLAARALTAPDRPPWALEALVQQRLAGTGGVVQRWSEARALGLDDLPMIGLLAGQAAAVACGYGLAGELQAVQAVRWAVAAMVTGRDPTPEPFRAGRPVAAGSL